jgi:hypothetical protein
MMNWSWISYLRGANYLGGHINTTKVKEIRLHAGTENATKVNVIKTK